MGSKPSSSLQKENAPLLCEHYGDPNKEETDSISEIMFRLMYVREKPVTAWQRFTWNLYNCWGCCYTFCCPPCPSCIIEKIAFAPPKPTYDFVQFGPSNNNDYRIHLSKDAKGYLCYFYPVHNFHSTILRGFYVEYTRRKRIACLYCRSSLFGLAPRKTLLLSHSNAEDIGLMIGRITDLSLRMAVDVLAYDYTGFGRSNGSCSERRIYDNIDCVYEFMIKKMKIPSRQIVAMGTSLGTTATIHLASRRQVRGVVLQGSFLSALRTMCPDRQDTSCIDQFVNVDKVHKITCPTLFVHGEHDKMFDLTQMTRLHARCPGAAKIEPLIVEGAEHVDFDRFDEYWEGLRKFIRDHLETSTGIRRGQKMVSKKSN